MNPSSRPSDSRSPIVENQANSSTLTIKESTVSDFENLCIDGERVRLRPATKRYAEEIFEEFTPEITLYMMPKPSDTLQGVYDVIDTFAEGRRKKEEIVFTILNKETEEFLGCCGIHGRRDGRNPELGLWLKKAAHGHGYGREAIHSLVAWARETLDVESFIYPVAKENIPSRKIPESLGGTVFEEKLVKTMRDTILDEVVYRIPG